MTINNEGPLNISPPGGEPGSPLHKKDKRVEDTALKALATGQASGKTIATATTTPQILKVLHTILESLREWFQKQGEHFFGYFPEIQVLELERAARKLKDPQILNTIVEDFGRDVAFNRERYDNADLEDQTDVLEGFGTILSVYAMRIEKELEKEQQRLH